MNGRPKKSWRRKKSWVPEEWAEGREEEEGARTIDTGADRRQALRLAPVERDVDPLETWREEQRRAKEEAQRRAARSPWSNTVSPQRALAPSFHPLNFVRWYKHCMFGSIVDGVRSDIIFLNVVTTMRLAGWALLVYNTSHFSKCFCWCQCLEYH